MVSYAGLTLEAKIRTKTRRTWRVLHVVITHFDVLVDAIGGFVHSSTLAIHFLVDVQISHNRRALLNQPCMLVELVQGRRMLGCSKMGWPPF